MRGWVSDAQSLIAKEGRLVLVTVARTQGSAPRRAGTKMLVSVERLVGTIGGGNLEYQVIEQARKLLAADGKPYVFQNYALGPLLEQCCGGNVDILLERLDADSAAFLKETPKTYLKTTFSEGCFVKEWADRYRRHAVIFYDDQDERCDVPKEAAVMVEEVLGKPHPLYVFGAGHVGRAVVEALAPLPFEVVWVDARADEFPDTLPENATSHIDENYVSYVDAAPAGALYLVFTHSHQLDYDLTSKILARGDAAYCGMIGSQTKRTRFEKRMLQEPIITEADLTNFTCPIGIEGISGNEPAIIAAAVAAQLLTVIS